MKSVFITGHTSGIGLAAYNYLISKGYEVSGGSRQTGFDIAKSGIYKDILKYDVLINNAYHKTGQLELLRNVYDEWAEKEKTIINVGSAHIPHQIGRPKTSLDYNVAKAALVQYSNWINANDPTCRSMMYNPGTVITPTMSYNADDWPKEDQDRVQKQIIQPIECAKTLEFMITAKTKFREVTQG